MARTSQSGPRPRTERRLLPGSGVLAVLALAACGGSGEAPPARGLVAHEQDGLEIREPRVHLMPDMGALYLSVVDRSDDGDRLLGVTTTAAAAAELHETISEGGVMRMEPRPEGFELPPGGILELAPGGKHAMLLSPHAQDGGPIRVTLTFERAGDIEIEARIRSLVAHGDPGEAPAEGEGIGEAAEDEGGEHEGMGHDAMSHGSGEA